MYPGSEYVAHINLRLCPFSADGEEERSEDEDVDVGEAAADEGDQQNPAGEEPQHGEPGDDERDEPDNQHHDGEPQDHPAEPLVLKRKRCATCYREAENRKSASKVKKVVTSCVRCQKPFCGNHLLLYCANCDVARRPQNQFIQERARYERERQELQDTVDRQRQQIDELQQQVRVLVPLVSCILSPYE